MRRGWPTLPGKKMSLVSRSLMFTHPFRLWDLKIGSWTRLSIYLKYVAIFAYNSVGTPDCYEFTKGSWASLFILRTSVWPRAAAGQTISSPTPELPWGRVPHSFLDLNYKGGGGREGHRYLPSQDTNTQLCTRHGARGHSRRGRRPRSKTRTQPRERHAQHAQSSSDNCCRRPGRPLAVVLGTQPRRPVCRDSED